MKRNNIKNVERKGRQKSDKLSADHADSSKAGQRRRASKIGQKLARACGSRVVSKLHQTTLSMFAVKRSASKKSSSKKSVKKGVPKLGSETKFGDDSCQPGTSAQRMPNSTGIASKWFASSSLFSFAFNGRRSRNGDDNIDSEAEMDDDATAAAIDYENVAPIASTSAFRDSDVRVSDQTASFGQFRPMTSSDNAIMTSSKNAAVAMSSRAIMTSSRDDVTGRASAFSRVVGEPMTSSETLEATSSALRDMTSSRMRHDDVIDARADDRFRFPGAVTVAHPQQLQRSRVEFGSSWAAVVADRPLGWRPGSNAEPCCSLQPMISRDYSNLGASDRVAYNPAFRASAPAHVATLKYRFGPVPLPQLKWADEQCVFNLMCWKDMVYCRNPHLMPQHPGLQPRMRSILIDWLSEVCEEYKLHRETFYLAIDFIDRFLSKQQNVSKDNLQLIGVTALFVAAKLEEIYPPKRSLFADITAGACTVDDIEAMEMILLKTLNWALCPITAIHWASTYMQIVGSLQNNQSSQQTDDRTQPSSSSYSNKPLIRRIMSDADYCNSCESRCVNGPPNGAVRSETPVPCLSDQNRRSLKRRSNANSDNDRVKRSKGDDFLYSTFQRYHFIHVARLIDLCIMDVGSLRFPYSVLAACAFAHVIEPENLALLVSGFKYDDIAVCYHWMIPFARCVQEKGDLCVKNMSDVVPDDDVHNIQTHAADLKLLECAQALQQDMLCNSRMSPVVFLNNNSLNSIFPTPPPSDERSGAHLYAPPTHLSKFSIFLDNGGDRQPQIQYAVHQ